MKIFRPLTKSVGRLWPKSAFARGVGTLVGGTAGAQLLIVMASPLLTRLYSPEDFGLLALYIGILALFATVASMRYELAIPLPESNVDAANLVVLCLAVVGGMTIVSALIVFFAGSSIASGLGAPGLAGYLWLLPPGVLFIGTYQVFNYWSIREKQFSLIARTRIWQAVSTIGIQLLFFKAGGVALMMGHGGGQGAGSAALAKNALHSKEFKSVDRSGLHAAAVRYREFPLFSTWSGLFNTAGQQLPAFMFAALFGVGAAGLYALAHRALALPMTVVGRAVGNVFFANAAEAYRCGQLAPLVSDVHEKLAHAAMPPMLVLVLVGPDLFVLVFGEPWRQAGEFARWMAPWLYMVFITSPLSTLFSIMEKQKEGMLFQGALLIVRSCAIAVGGWYGDLLVAVALFSLGSALCWIGFLVWISVNSGNRIGAIARPTLSAFLIASMCVLPLSLGLIGAADAMWLFSLFLTISAITLRYWLLFGRSEDEKI